MPVNSDDSLVEATAEASDPGQAGASSRPAWWRRARVAPLSIAVATIWVVVDQITKQWALNTLGDGREVHVVWTLQWNLSFNTGMAFSRGEGFGPFIGVLAVLIVIVLIVTSAHVDSRLAKFAAGMLIGGAIGNLVDRAFRDDGWLHGAVVDFIDFQWFPIFNVADIGVTVGAALFAIATIRASRDADRAAALAATGVSPVDVVGPDEPRA
jgi:signal peptidase II